jgi:alpha-glucosidase
MLLHGNIWLANIQMQRMSISGMGFGFRYSGFAEQPSAELYARWIQLGVFPFCRTHSGHHGEQEPWSFWTRSG